MKLKYCFFFYILFMTVANAQVGIGTTSPNASLDVRSSNQAAPANTDGMLIPKIDAFPASNPTASQQGMLVFLTTASGANVAGFYYWNNPTTSWIAVGSTLTNNWSLLGNTNTTASNFFGTTDDKDIIFKRNNIRAGYIGDPSTNLNTSFGANSLVNPTINLGLQQGIRNAAFGTNVMPGLTIARRNVAVGDVAMFSVTSGSENTAMGVGALYSNQIGAANVAIGRNTLTSATAGNNTGVGFATLRQTTAGTNNTALGSQAGYNTQGNFNVLIGNDTGYGPVGNAGSGNTVVGNTAGYSGSGSSNVMMGNAAGYGAAANTGANNTIIGNTAGYNLTGNSNVFVGNAAGYNETGSNRLYISNSNADATNALVYGEFDNKILRANGQLQINNPTTTGYKFPTARGTNKQTLETDASGNVSWVNGVNNLSLARVALSSNQNFNNSGWQKITFNSIAFDTNSEFNTGTNQFVATKAGYYQINAAYHTYDTSSTLYFAIGVRVNGTIYYQEAGARHTGSGPVYRNITSLVSLNVGDYVEIYAQVVDNGITIDSYSGKTFVDIQQIR